MIKVNDVIEVRLSIKALDVPEEVMRVNFDDYDQRFDISYFMDGKYITGYDFEIEAGYAPDFGYEIEECIKEELKNTFEEIEEYEVFDIDDKDFTYQKAKIKVLKVNDEA